MMNNECKRPTERRWKLHMIIVLPNNIFYISWVKSDLKSKKVIVIYRTTVFIYRILNIIKKSV